MTKIEVESDLYHKLVVEAERYQQAMAALRLIAEDSDEKHIKNFAEERITTIESLVARNARKAF